MKNNLIKNTIVMALLFSTTSIFCMEKPPKKELLKDIKEQTKKCTIQLIASAGQGENEKVIGFKSQCNTLKIISMSEAQIFIDGEWLTANITESAESDGGDLDDLTIVNSFGEVVVTKTNIASYDSVLVAMAGDSNFKKMYTK